MALRPAQWDDFIANHAGHLLQSWAWGELKSHFGWSVVRVQVAEAAAQILFRRLPLGRTIAYIPKGPVVNWTEPEQCQALLATIHAEAKKRQAIFLKIEPYLWQVDSDLSPHPAESALNFLHEAGFVSADTIQPRTSLIIDVSGDETAILAAMKQKTRYNIRLAQKKGIIVDQGNSADIDTFYDLSLTTAARDGFGIHSLDYYQIVYTLFSPDRCALLIAQFENKPLAALMVFKHGQDAYYFYGASADEQRQLMPTYLIQWAAIEWAKSRGCTRYDLWGIPEADPATLEAEFQRRHDGLWGVYRFKRGFGGRVVQSLGAFDYIYNPWLYQLYKLHRLARGYNDTPYPYLQFRSNQLK